MKSSTRISNFFQFKDKMLNCLRSNVVYKLSCGRCSATYYGKTWRHLSVRVGETLGVSPLTRKKIKVQKVYSSKGPYGIMWLQRKSFNITWWTHQTINNETSLLFTYLIDPSQVKLYCNDIYYCYSYCINVTIVN